MQEAHGAKNVKLHQKACLKLQHWWVRPFFHSNTQVFDANVAYSHRKQHVATKIIRPASPPPRKTSELAFVTSLTTVAVIFCLLFCSYKMPDTSDNHIYNCSVMFKVSMTQVVMTSNGLLITGDWRHQRVYKISATCVGRPQDTSISCPPFI